MFVETAYFMKQSSKYILYFNPLGNDTFLQATKIN